MVGLTAIVLMLALAPSSFAQIELRLFNTPAAQEVSTDRHVRTADIGSPGAGLLVSGVLIAASTLTTTTMTLTFPATITSSKTFPDTTEGIRVEGATGLFSSINSGSVTVGTTTIAIVLPGIPAPGNSESGSFRITGVRLNGPGLATPANLAGASLSSSANNYISPTTLPTLVSATGAGLGALSIGPTIGTAAGTVTIFTNQSGATPTDDNGTFTIAEGIASAWRTSTQNSVNGTGGGGTVSGTGVRFTISGLPAGMTAVITPTGSFPSVVEASISLTSAAASGTFTFNGADVTVVESKSFSIRISGAPTGTLTAGAITLVATLAPVAPTSGTGSASPYTAGTFPKYTVADTAALTVGNIIVAKTTLLLPYAVSIGANGANYNTGIAIANTTMDPFGTTGGATAAAGKLTFYAYKRSDSGAATTTATYATVNNTLGAGLTSAGLVPAGGLFTGLMNQILANMPTLTGDFLGYLFIETDFLNAHGVAYLLTGPNISSGLPIMVLPQPTAVSRNIGSPGTGSVETLGF
jgi:hypothetical protein